MKACKILSVSVLIFAGSVAAFAQSSGSKSSGLTMPAMPSVSAPTMGNGFYTPGSAGFYQGQRNVPASTPKNAESGEQTKDNTEKSAAAAADFSQSLSGQYAAATKLSNALTASDISSMDNLGMLGSFSSLLGGNKISAASASTDNLLLQRILSELTELKAKIGDGSKPGAGFSAKTEEIHSSKGPSILRFTINGTNILSGCRTVFFSKQESDGSFLLTGDCKYLKNGETHTETFHLLFHANGTQNSSTTFSVTPAITQDAENKNSLLYRMCQSKNLVAVKTGNMVSLRSAENGVNTDLLLGLE